ncbi:hypothetical protein ACFFRR_004125, partial [Megaselia abdita]
AFIVSFKDRKEFSALLFKSEMAKTAMYAYPVTDIICVTGIFIATMVKKAQRFKLIALIVKLDRQGLRIDYYKIKRFSLYWICGIFIMLSSGYISSTILMRVDVLLFFSVIMPHYYSWCYTMKFVVIIYCIKLFLEEINV